MERVILAAGILLLLLSLGILFYVRRSLVVYSRELMDCLDKMLKDEDVVFAEEKESLTGKIQVKMRQLYEASRCQREEQRIQKEQLETMIADLSHQIKTPIAGIRMYNDFLEQEHLPPEKKKGIPYTGTAPGGQAGIPHRKYDENVPAGIRSDPHLSKAESGPPSDRTGSLRRGVKGREEADGVLCPMSGNAAGVVRPEMDRGSAF